jgi:DNA-binding response OmpR family regulator
VATILLVDNDPALVDALGRALGSEGYTVRFAQTAAEAALAIESARPDLVLLDLMLPDTDGLVLLEKLRQGEASSHLPVIVLSGRQRQVDRVLSLKFGADDFVAKPFEYEDLLARIQAVLRRAELTRQTPCESSDGDICSGALVISTRRASVKFAGVRVALTPTEFRLLATLASRPEETLSRQTLARMLWGYVDAGTGHMIDVHIGRLRAKLRAIAEPVPLETVHNQGFTWRVTDQPG